jgi:hypothetical protein
VEKKKYLFFYFIFILLILITTGCLNYSDDPENFQANETVPVTFHYNNDSSSISVNMSAIEVNDIEDSPAKIASVIDIALDDPRAGILLENGWTIVSFSKPGNKDMAGNPSAELEFRKDNLSFYLDIDEEGMTTTGGYSDAVGWISGSVSGPLPLGYHKSKDKATGRWYVLNIQSNSSNSTVAMIYNDTTIFYLYPSYSIIDLEGLYD